jgi:cell wall-associated NlpC family hydrolase
MSSPSSPIADVQARIAEIQARFSGVRPKTSTSGADFAGLLSQVLGSDGGSLTGTVTAAGATGAATGEAVVADAQRYLGVPYVWGGTDPATGLDCSGLVQRVYRDLGITLPRVAADQARVGTPVASLADAKPGDLVAFGSPVDHIGIYAGDGQMIVAPKTGDVVKIQRITGTPTAIRRVIGTETSATAAAAGLRRSGAPADLTALFQAATQRYGLPPGLLHAVARAESGFNTGAVSPAGALGLMQIMPATARGLGVDPLDPAQAVDGAARLLSQNLQRFGSVDLAVAAYNAGPAAVAHYGGVPPYGETQTYVPRVLAYMQEAA